MPNFVGPDLNQTSFALPAAVGTTTFPQKFNRGYIESWNLTSSHGGKATGNVSISVNGTSRTAEAEGNGPVDALYEAIDLAVEPSLGWRPNLAEYEIRAVSEGEDAQGQVSVKCRRSSDIDADGRPLADSRIVSGQGLSTNIIDASLVAYITAANKLAAIESGAASAPTKGSREAMQ